MPVPGWTTVITGRPATTPEKAMTPEAAAWTGAPAVAARSTPRCPGAQGASGASNWRSTPDGPPTGQARPPEGTQELAGGPAVRAGSTAQRAGAPGSARGSADAPSGRWAGTAALMLTVGAGGDARAARGGVRAKSTVVSSSASSAASRRRSGAGGGTQPVRSDHTACTGRAGPAAETSADAGTSGGARPAATSRRARADRR